MLIHSPVGSGCPNERSDVRLVQKLLQQAGVYQGTIDGLYGPQTKVAILEYQRHIVSAPDARIDPAGPTWKRLVAESKAAEPQERPADSPSLLTEADYEEAARILGCEVAAIKAVAEVESAGAGFLMSGKPRILFEGHWFYRHTKGAYALTHPTLCHKNQTNEHYAKGSPEGRGASELARLETAMQLNSRAALLSCSVGKFQVMGFNYRLCGFSTVEQFWELMAKGEREHLKAFCAFVKSKGLAEKLLHHRWDKFAEGYNGSNYKKFSYDSKIASAYARFTAQENRT